MMRPFVWCALLSSCIVALVPSCSKSAPRSTEDYLNCKYQPGQVWTYRTRPEESDSRLTVVKVESYEKIGMVVHIYLDGLVMRDPKAPYRVRDSVSHLPLAEAALDASVVSMVATDVELPHYEEGYRIWKSAFDKGHAGIFTITVAESVNVIEDAPRQ